MRVVWRWAALIAVMAAAPSYAACDVQPESGGRLNVQGPIRERFNRLLQQDRFTNISAKIIEWQSLLADARAGGAENADIVARGNGWLGWSLDYVNKVDPALAAAREGIRTIETEKLWDHAYASEVLASLVMVEVDAGMIEAASRDSEKALTLAARFGANSVEVSFAHNAAGSVAYAKGEYAEAEEHYRLASEIAQACLPPTDAFIVNQMSSRAGILYMLGRSEQALSENERAANWAVAHLAEDNPVVTLALGNLGVVLRSAGRYPEAEAALRRVVDLEARYQKESYYYRAISLSNFASVIDRQGRHIEAEALWLKSSEFHKRVAIKRDPVQAAYPLRFSADAAQARGDLALALSRRAEGLKLVEKDAPADHPEVARARIEYALTLMLLGRAAEARQIASPAITIVRAKLAVDDVKRMLAEIAYGRIVAAVAGPEAGYRLVSPIAARLETKLLDTATGRSDLIRYGPVFSASFATVTELALRTHRDDDAFHWLQLANLSDIALVSTDVAVRAAARSDVARSSLRELQDRVQARQSLERSRTFAAASNEPQKVARIDAQIAANDAQIVLTARYLDTEFPAFRALSRPVPVKLETFRARLGASQILIAPLPGDSGTLAIAVTSEGLFWRKSALPGWGISERVGAIRKSIDLARARSFVSAPFAERPARDLYDAIMPRDGAQLFARHPDMLYFASGALASVPPSLFIAPGSGPTPNWLVRTHSVTMLPTLGRDGSSATNGPQLAFLGVGAPTVRGGAVSAGRSETFRGIAVDRDKLRDLPALPHARQELQSIASLLGWPTTLLLGDEATEKAIKSLDLRSFGIIAFATHGLVGNNFAGLTEPALVVSGPSGGDSADDSLLTASEIAGLKLNADWVILSACNTADGMGAGTPAYSGLASAFTAAGARALLVSHWPVRDDAAQSLTVGTVRGTQAGLGRARALQQAMLATLSAGSPAARHPAFWAPFVLIER